MKKYKFIKGADFPDENISFSEGEIRYGKVKNPDEQNENRVIITIYKNGKSTDVPLKVSEGLYLVKETKMFTSDETFVFVSTALVSLVGFGLYKLITDKDGK